MNLSREQHRLLGLMGYQVMVRAEPGDLLASRRTAPAESAPVSAGIRTPASAATRAPAPAMRTPAIPPALHPDALAAFERAVRLAAGNRDIAAVVDDLERLRRDPSLKKALWPRLRALRRSH